MIPIDLIKEIDKYIRTCIECFRVCYTECYDCRDAVCKECLEECARCKRKFCMADTMMLQDGWITERQCMLH